MSNNLTLEKGLKSRIKVRNPKWDFSDIQNLDDFGTFNKLMWYALSLVFPEGERFFIRSVKRFQDQITDPQLQKDIKAFIAQETQHGRMHEMFNDQFILKKPAGEITNRGPRGEAFQMLENFIVNSITPKLTLAMTAAAEHYTAAWAKIAFDDERVKNLPESLRNLIYWHATEEVEHKHVAFDVMEEVDGTYLLRISGMVVQSFLMGTNLPSLFLELLRKEENVDYGKLVQDVVREATNKGGLIRSFVEAFWDYMRPGFHPNDDTSDLVRAAEVTKELDRYMNVA